VPKLENNAKKCSKVVKDNLIGIREFSNLKRTCRKALKIGCNVVKKISKNQHTTFTSLS